ncbi:MAG: hypothetical protein KF709_04685 [Gemmatimonadaceae bacterium]|nr:hypothetical protein [Gemmatimonadaceae bacterium]
MSDLERNQRLVTGDSNDAVRRIEARLSEATRRHDALPDPEARWRDIQAELQRPSRADDGFARRRVPRSLAVAAGLAALMLGGLAGAVRQYAAPDAWRVVSFGSDAAPSALTAGEWLETDSDQRLRLQVGRIGTADVGPDSRLRLERGKWSEHRLSLERGSLDVIIEAPPRLFFVQTPRVLATDLGCAYTLEVAEGGATRLAVTAGWVELGENGRRSLVPAGMEASVAADGVPGTPVVAELPAGARDALARIDRSQGTADDVALLVAAMPAPEAAVVTRQLAGITLWHALQRVEADLRAPLVQALAQLNPAPTGVTTEGIVALDRRMLDDWRRSLNPMWGEEDAPVWVALGRKLWLWAMD